MTKIALAAAPALSYRSQRMLWQRRVLALAASCALCLPGCGGSDVDADLGEERNLGGSSASTAGQAGSGSAPGAGAGSGGSGSATAGGASAGGLSAGGSGGGASLAACSTFIDEPNAWSLVVQIKNERQTPVYLGQDTATCEAQRLFQVEDGARQILPSLDGCHVSCQALMQTGPVSCPSTCATPSTITLNPGQTIKVPWDGRYGMSHSLPEQCLVGSSAATSTCMQARRIEASVFTFSARAGTSRSCLAASGCNCAADQYGACTTPSSLITGTIITTELLIKLEPGMGSAGETPYIALVFKD